MNGSVTVAGCILPCELTVLQDAEECGNDLGPAAKNRSTVRFPQPLPGVNEPRKNLVLLVRTKSFEPLPGCHRHLVLPAGARVSLRPSARTTGSP